MGLSEGHAMSDEDVQNTLWSMLICQLALLVSPYSKLPASAISNIIVSPCTPSPKAGGLKW